MQIIKLQCMKIHMIGSMMNNKGEKKPSTKTELNMIKKNLEHQTRKTSCLSTVASLQLCSTVADGALLPLPACRKHQRSMPVGREKIKD